KEEVGVPSSTLWYWRNHLNLGGRKIFLHTPRRIRLDADISNPRRCLAVLAQIEARQRNGPLRNPPRCLLPVGFGRLLGRSLRRFTCRHKRPVLRITELEIEIRHLHAAIGIPCAPRSHIEQSATLFLQNFSTVY